MIIIKGGKILDPSSSTDRRADILIDHGKIQRISKDIDVAGVRIMDATGKTIVPGFIDAHVHLREPGYEYKESIRTGTMAAAAGGFTTVACMPNTNPAIHTKEIVEYVMDKAKREGIVHVLPIGSITMDIEGKKLSEIGAMVNAGIVAISDDGKTSMDISIMEEAIQTAKKYNIPLIDHCEDHHLAANGSINEGKAVKRTGLKGIPNEAEWTIVARDINLSKVYGAHVHIAHVSTKESVDLIRKAKHEGINITCEVCPHHFALTDEVVERYKTETKVNPPLRSAKDVNAIIEGIVDGTIDIIATDHAPHDAESKAVSYENASFGISGLETAFSISHMELVVKNKISLGHLIEMLTNRPAKILNIRKGSLMVGSDADITILDLNKTEYIDSSIFLSKGKNTPFNEKMVKGKVISTLVNGKMVMDGGKIICS